MDIAIPRDANDIQVQLSAYSVERMAPETFLDVKKMKGAPAALKLSNAIFSIEAGMVVYLWWDDEFGDTLILPLEGRGTLNFDPFGGIVNPRRRGWSGCVQLSTSHEGMKSFFIGLEFAKLKE